MQKIARITNDGKSIMIDMERLRSLLNVAHHRSHMDPMYAIDEWMPTVLEMEQLRRFIHAAGNISAGLRLVEHLTMVLNGDSNHGSAFTLADGRRIEFTREDLKEP